MYYIKISSKINKCNVFTYLSRLRLEATPSLSEIQEMARKELVS